MDGPISIQGRFEHKHRCAEHEVGVNSKWMAWVLALWPGFGTAITPPLSRNATSCDSLGCQSEVPGQNGVSESQRDVMCEQTPLGAGVESGVTTSDRRLCRFDVRDPAVMSGDGNFFNHG